MKPEKQVAPFAQARRFKELGVKQQSLFYWGTEYTYTKDDDPVETPVLYYREGIIGWGIEPASVDSIYAAYTVAELRVALPPFSYSWRGGDLRWSCIPSTINPNVRNSGYTLDVSLFGTLDISLFKNADTEAEALSDLLLHLIETGQITLEEVNRRLTEA